MITRILGQTAKMNLPRELKLESVGDEVHVSALNPPETAGWMVRIPRDAFVVEMGAFLAGCQLDEPPSAPSEASAPAPK